ncbi:MAG: MBL fold metallo-hydrolase, partial [Deinococcus sp.]
MSSSRSPAAFAPPVRHGPLSVAWLSTGPVQENAVLAWGPEGGGFLLDPGDEPERILAWMEALGVQPQAILLTHAHFDHIGAVQPLRERLGLPVSLHPGGRALYDAGARSAARWNLPFVQPQDPDHDVAAGQTFTAGGLTLTARDLPGHAPGHVVFVGSEGAAPDGGAGTPLFAVVGDTLFQGSVG